MYTVLHKTSHIWNFWLHHYKFKEIIIKAGCVKHLQNLDKMYCNTYTIGKKYVLWRWSFMFQIQYIELCKETKSGDLSSHFYHSMDAIWAISFKFIMMINIQYIFTVQIWIRRELLVYHITVSFLTTMQP